MHISFESCIKMEKTGLSHHIRLHQYTKLHSDKSKSSLEDLFLCCDNRIKLLHKVTGFTASNSRRLQLLYKYPDHVDKNDEVHLDQGQ